MVIDEFALARGVGFRGSLSAYYHSFMRDEFVSCLVVTGLLLITYRWAEKG